MLSFHFLRLSTAPIHWKTFMIILRVRFMQQKTVNAMAILELRKAYHLLMRTRQTLQASAKVTRLTKNRWFV